jgi:hypothetical protein
MSIEYGIASDSGQGFSSGNDHKGVGASELRKGGDKMSDFFEAYSLVAFTNKGQLIAKTDQMKYPTFEEVKQFAEGYQQADFYKVEKTYRFAKDLGLKLSYSVVE